MVFAAATRRVYPGFWLWTAFFVTLPVCFLLFALRGALPELFTIVVAHALNLAGIIALQEGTSRFLDLAPDRSLKINLLATGVATGAIAWFTYGDPSVSARIAVISVAQMLLALHAGLKPHFCGKPLPKAIYLFTVPILLYAFFPAIRGARALRYDYADVFAEGWTLNAVVIVVVLLAAATAMGCLLMTSERAVSEAGLARWRLDNLLSNLDGLAYRVWMKSDEEIIEYASDGIERLTGYPPTRFLGKSTASFLDSVDPADLAVALAELQSSIDEKRRYSVTYRFAKATGDVRWFWDRGLVLSDGSDGRVVRDGFIADITERVEAEAEKARLVEELKLALSEVKTLSGLIPICASCKKIRDDKGYWNNLEQYIMDHTGADFTHGICPDCASRLYPLINTPEKT